jgi:hypothetical protein
MPASVLLAALLATAAAAPALAAEDAVAGWNPRTGSARTDQLLADINRYGARYRDAFVDELVRYHAAPREYVEGLLDAGWTPGDVFYACAIGEAGGRSCRYVAEQWQRDHGQGWGAVAQRIGVAPGSAQAARLQQTFAPMYRRWGRPLPD